MWGDKVHSKVSVRCSWNELDIRNEGPVKCQGLLTNESKVYNVDLAN